MKTNTIELLSELYPPERFCHEDPEIVLQQQESLFDTLLTLAKKDPFCMLEAFNFCEKLAQPDSEFKKRRYAKLFLSSFSSHSNNRKIVEKQDLISLKNLFNHIWQETNREDKMSFITYFSELPVIISHELLNKNLDYFLPETPSPIIFYNFLAKQIKSYHSSSDFHMQDEVDVFATSLEDTIKNRRHVQFNLICLLFNEAGIRWPYLKKHFLGTHVVSSMKSSVFQEAYHIMIKTSHAFAEHYHIFLDKTQINPFVFLMKDDLNSNIRFYTDYFEKYPEHCKHSILQLDKTHLKNLRLHDLFFQIARAYQFKEPITELARDSTALLQKIEHPEFFQKLFLINEIQGYLNGVEKNELITYTATKIWKLAEKFQHCHYAELENAGKQIEYGILDYTLKNISILFPENNEFKKKEVIKKTKI